MRPRLRRSLPEIVSRVCRTYRRSCPTILSAATWRRIHTPSNLRHRAAATGPSSATAANCCATPQQAWFRSPAERIGVHIGLGDFPGEERALRRTAVLSCRQERTQGEKGTGWIKRFLRRILKAANVLEQCSGSREVQRKRVWRFWW